MLQQLKLQSHKVGDTEVATGIDKIKQRDSNLELFRIITMLLIIAHHYVVNSGLTSVGGPIYADAMSGRSIFLLLLGAWGKIGINCFVLITGYFMCKSKISLTKFLKLFLAVMFYRLVIYAIFLISGYEPFSLKSFVKTVIPIYMIGTNFTSTYLVFFLFIPFLNILIGNMDERKHLLLILLLSFTYVFMGTIPYFSVTMNYVSWYMVLYFIASYVRLYPKRIFDENRIVGWILSVLLVLDVASVLSCTWLGSKIGRNMSYGFVSDSNTLLAVLTGLFAFCFFKNLKIRYSKIINTVASTTFGVLLIHANSDTMRQWLWKDTLNNVGAYGLSWMPLHAIGSVLGVFIMCSLIDLVRIKCIERPFFCLWSRKESKLIAKWKAFEQKRLSSIGIE